MSQYYRMSIIITDHEHGMSATEQDAIDKLFTERGFEPGDRDEEVYSNCSEFKLYSGQSPSEWTDDIAKEVWTVTKRPVVIEVDWWWEEREPDESYRLDTDHFEAMFPALTQLAMTADDEE